MSGENKKNNDSKKKPKRKFPVYDENNFIFKWNRNKKDK